MKRLALICLLVLGPVGAASTQSPAEWRERAREVLSEDLGYQTELPGIEGPESVVADESDFDRESLEKKLTFLKRVAEVLGWIAWPLLWLGLAITVVCLVVWFTREIARRSSATARGARSGPIARDEALPREVELSEIEALVAAGSYTEAIHLLLLRAFADLEAVTRPLRPAWTSREAVRSVEVDGEARRTLAGLVLAVEVSVFGGRPAGRDDYERAREHFDLFREGLAGASR